MLETLAHQVNENPALVRELLGGGVPAHLWQDARVRAFAAGAQVLTD